MIVLINLISIATILLLYLLSFKTLAVVLLVVFCALFYLIGTGFILSFLLNHLQKKYKKNDVPIKSNNAIVLLGTGVQKVSENLEPSFLSYSRLYRVLDVYNLCLKNNASCKIILSGYEATTYRESLLSVGVEGKFIYLEGQSKNTFENAKFTKEIIEANNREEKGFEEKGFDNIILLSSSIHLKRAELYFNHFNLKTTPCRGDYFLAKKSYIPKAYNFALMDFVLHEYIGILRYYVDNFLGINPKLK